VIVADAHQYLLDHYADGWDFIWSSPPCPTHSTTNWFLNAQGVIRYPDMCLWQEILLMVNFCETKYCIENVKSYYQPLIIPQEIGRHYYWANFIISPKEFIDQIGRFNGENQARNRSYKLDKIGFNLDKYSIKDKDGLLRNCVLPELGLHIFNMAFKHKQSTLGVE
jgi:DNA (cytosine-5)-methyltransferase 1